MMMMMMRSVLAGVALAIGIAAASGQADDPVLERSKLMKAQGQHIYGPLNRMMRGQEPYDQAKVDAGFATLADTSKKLPPLFPEATKGKRNPDSEYFASTKIWENKGDFDSWLAKLAKDVAENATKAKSLDGLKEAYAAVRRNCDGCHETYRVKKS